MKELETLFTKFHFFIVDEKRIYVVHHKIFENDDNWGDVFYLRNILNNNLYRASMFWREFSDFVMCGRARQIPPRPEVILSYSFEVYW